MAFVQFLVWCVLVFLASFVIDGVTGWSIGYRVIGSGLSTYLWFYWTKRMWDLTRTHKTKSVRRLAITMTAALAPLPLFLISEPMGLSEIVDMALTLWVAFLSVFSLFLGFMVHSAAQSSAEAQGLKEDTTAQQAELSERRRVGGRDRGALRWLQLLIVTVGVVVLFVQVTAGVHSGLRASAVIVGWLSALSVLGFHWTWTRRSPQRGAAFSPSAALLDVVLPSMIGVFSFIIGHVSLIAMSQGKVIATSIGLTLVVTFAQVPSMLMRWERKQWRRAWAQELKEALAAYNAEVVSSGDAEDPLALDTSLRARVNPSGRNDFQFALYTSTKAELITGDDAFDARFVVRGEPLHVLGIFTSAVRAAALALHPHGLGMTPAEATCRVAYPWRVQAEGKALAGLAALARLPADGAALDHLRARALDGALSDPVPAVRCLCAQALLDDWRARRVHWQQLKEQLGHDATSVALIEALTDAFQSDPYLQTHQLKELLADPTPWPAQGGAFAQALCVLALDQMSATSKYAALSPPMGRLAALDVPFAVTVAVSVCDLESEAEAWTLDVLARARYAEHRVKLCKTLGAIGTIQSLSHLRVLANDATADATARDAARDAADVLSRRLNLSDLAGGLALSDLGDAGALSIAAPPP